MGSAPMQTFLPSALITIVWMSLSGRLFNIELHCVPLVTHLTGSSSLAVLIQSHLEGGKCYYS
jgi:hypothetical protein